MSLEMLPSSPLSRRGFLRAGTVAAGTIALSGPARALLAEEPGRFTTRPKKSTKETAPGEYVLADDNGRRAVLYVPPSYDPTKPAPFMLALHGATGSGDSMLRGQRGPAEKAGVIVLSPSSRDGTWDAIRGMFSYDVTKVDGLLAQTFDRCNIDPKHVAIGGFSDGATYAVSLGLINGDFFTHIIAHSPGFIIPGAPHGKPKVFVSHGHQDPILPFERCGARIVEILKRAGYSPRFDEFDGGHTATPEMRGAALSWFTAG